MNESNTFSLVLTISGSTQELWVPSQEAADYLVAGARVATSADTEVQAGLQNTITEEEWEAIFDDDPYSDDLISRGFTLPTWRHPVRP